MPTTADDSSRLTTFLLDLYALSRSTPTQDFSRQAMDCLQHAVRFDSGLWATFTATAAGPSQHWRYLHNLPDTMLESYERVKQYDLVNQQAVTHAGRTFNVSLADAAPLAHPSIVKHARRWGMEHTLATMEHESPINLFTAVCLYRNDPADPFTEPERRLKELIVPHLVQAWHINAFHLLDASPAARGGTRARALVDPLGVIHNAEPGFSALLQREVPAWQGPSLPAPLNGVLEPAGHYKGRALVLRCVERLPDHTIVVDARSRGPVDTLSPRQLAVAREFASGKNYKQIAKQFGTSPTTVRSQLQTVYERLGVRTKVGLIKAIESSR